jgi:GNAT superfamily N-acetyltransferase
MVISMSEKFIIREAIGVADMLVAHKLIEKYMSELGEDLCFQGVHKELAELPVPYARPDGAIFFAIVAGEVEPTAMIALKKLDAKTCEMKRLYVAPEHRKLGMGEALVKRLIEHSRILSYEIMRLDTLDRLKPAIAIYTRLGFVKTKAYNKASLDGIVYFEKTL